MKWSWLALGLMSCTPAWTLPTAPHAELPGTIHVCLDLPVERLAEATEAVALWDMALRGWKRVRVSPGPVSMGCSVIVKETTAEHSSQPHALAWAIIGGDVIWMKRGRYERDTTGILLHELGHAFGADHLPGGLMDPAWTPNSYRCPDFLTVVQVAAWQHAPLSAVAWCNY